MDSKKMAAATAAVITYIKTQEEAACFASSQEKTSGASGLTGPFPAACINTWCMAGRGDQMQGRSLMQMGVFR